MALNCDERTHVQIVVRRRKANARTLTRARVLLKSDDCWIDAEIAEALDISQQIVHNIRQIRCSVICSLYVAKRMK